MTKETQGCSAIKESLLAYFGQQTGVLSFDRNCVITLPLRTLDDRNISVFIDRKLEDYFVVHDGGKNLGELFVQGIKITETKKKQLEAMAKRFGVSISPEGIFTRGCKLGQLEDSILSITQCASLCMMEVLSHHAVIEEEPLETKVSRSLNKWKPDYVREIGRRVAIQGTQSTHSFDFVSFSSDEEKHKTVAVEILSPTYSARLQADRYGFLVLDIKNSHFDRWARLAVVQKVEMWPRDSMRLIQKLSNEVIALGTDQEPEIEQLLPPVMDQLAA